MGETEPVLICRCGGQLTLLVNRHLTFITILIALPVAISYVSPFAHRILKPMKMTLKTILFSFAAAAILALPALSYAQDADTSSTTATKPTKHSKHGAPFHGTLDAVDTNAMTFTVGSRTFGISSETRIMKDDQPAILADGVVGQPVSGYYKPSDDGTNLIASSVYFGKHAKAKAKAKKKPTTSTPSTASTESAPSAPSVPSTPPAPPTIPPPPSTPPAAMTPPPAPPEPGTNSSPGP